MRERQVRREELQQEPGDQQEAGGEPPRQEPEEERHDAGVREEHEVGAEHGGDRAARADVRDARRRHALARLVQRRDGLNRHRGVKSRLP